MQNTSNTSNTQTTQSSSPTSTFNLLPKTIVLSNSLIQSSLSKQAKIAYIALKYSLHTPVSYICTDELAIPFLPSEPNDIPSKLITILREGLQELHNNNFIKIERNISNTLYLIDATEIFTNTSNFTVINTEDIQAIVNLELSKWYNYIIFYCIVSSLINSNYKYSFVGIVKLKSYCGMSHDTIKKVATILSDNNILYSEAGYQFFQKQNTLLQGDTIKYYFPKDKEEALKNIQKYSNMKLEEEELAQINRNIKKRKKNTK